MRFWKMAALAGLALAVVAGCASSKLTEAGKGVRVVSDESVVSGCELVATLTVSADSITKSEEAKLRENIARNRAAEEGANAVIAVGDLMDPDGTPKQKYNAYLCK